MKFKLEVDLDSPAFLLATLDELKKVLVHVTATQLEAVAFKGMHFSGSRIHNGNGDVVGKWEVQS